MSQSICLLYDKGWDTYISDEFWSIIKELERKGVKLFNTEERTNEWKDYPIALFWETYEFCENNIDDYNGFKVFFCDDLHYNTSKRRMQRLNVFNKMDLLLATYDYLIDDLYPECKTKHLWIPHSISQSFNNIQYNNNPIEKCILSGADSYHYPLRIHLKKIMPKDKLEIMKHPGYTHYPSANIKPTCKDKDTYNNSIRSKYVKKLNKYLVGFTCGSIYNYALGKMFEIPGSSSLLVTDESMEPILRKLDFIPGKNYVSSSWDTMQKTIEDIIDNPKKYENIRKNGWNLIRNNHTYKNRANKIYNILSGGRKNKTIRIKILKKLKTKRKSIK